MYIKSYLTLPSLLALSLLISPAHALSSLESLTNPDNLIVASSSQPSGKMAADISYVSQLREKQDFSNEEAQKQLQGLLQMQQSMSQQINELKVRIEKNESQANDNTNQLGTVTESTEEQGGILDVLSKRIKTGLYIEQGYRLYSNAPRTPEFIGHGEGEGAVSTRTDSNTFDFRRVYLLPTAQFTDKLSYYGELEFVEGGGIEEIHMDESYFYYNHKPWLNLKAGILVPFMTPSSRFHKATERLMADRPLVDTYVIPSTLMDLGVAAYGTFPVGKRSSLNYEVQLTNGIKDTLDEHLAEEIAEEGEPASTFIEFNGLRPMSPFEETSIVRDNNSNKAMFGRLGYTFFPGFDLGVSGYYGKYDNRDRKALGILTSDLRYRYKRLFLLGEYANAMFQRGVGVNSQDVPFSLFPTSVNGYLAQASYDLTDKLTAVTSYQNVDLDESVSGNSLWRYTFGFRYNPAKKIYLKAEYQATSPRDRFDEEKFSHALVTQLTFETY